MGRGLHYLEEDFEENVQNFEKIQHKPKQFDESKRQLPTKPRLIHKEPEVPRRP